MLLVIVMFNDSGDWTELKCRLKVSLPSSNMLSSFISTSIMYSVSPAGKVILLGVNVKSTLPLATYEHDS